MRKDKINIPLSKPLIGVEESKAVLSVLSSGNLAQSSTVEKFEEAFANYLGVKHAIATSSGTAALHTALLSFGIGPQDEVITSPFSFIATANAISYTGAKPVFVDIDPKTYNLDPKLIEAAITSQTKAILPVHLFGLPADMEAIIKIAKHYNLTVIEDACQAHGAKIKDEMVGQFGTGCFSFYPTKNMTTSEGGMITTNNDTVAKMCRIIRQHGSLKKHYHPKIGFNYRMTEIAAAIGLVQLNKLDNFNDQRIANARLFSDHIRSAELPTHPPFFRHVFNQYTIRVNKKIRNKLVENLQEIGIGVGIYYPIPIHKQKIYSKFNLNKHLPIAEKNSQEVLSLPVHPALKMVDLEIIINSVNKFTES